MRVEWTEQENVHCRGDVTRSATIQHYVVRSERGGEHVEAIVYDESRKLLASMPLSRLKVVDDAPNVAGPKRPVVYCYGPQRDAVASILYGMGMDLKSVWDGEVLRGTENQLFAYVTQHPTAVPDNVQGVLRAQGAIIIVLNDTHRRERAVAKTQSAMSQRLVPRYLGDDADQRLKPFDRVTPRGPTFVTSEGHVREDRSDPEGGIPGRKE